MKKFLLLLLLTLWSAVAVAQLAPVRQVVGEPRGVKLSGAALDRETQRVGSLLRCPVCQGLSISDSPAEMAVQMKRQTREMLAAGYSDEQVMNYFEKSYGEFVRLEPERRGINWIVWIAPGALLLAGIFFIFRRMTAARPAEQSEDEAEVTETVDEDELAPWIARVRAVAYGSRENS